MKDYTWGFSNKWPAWWWWGSWDVTAAATLTNDKIVRWDTAAKAVQTSWIWLDDSDNLTWIWTIWCWAITSTSTVKTNTDWTVDVATTKTLDVNENLSVTATCTLDQDLQKSAWPQFATIELWAVSDTTLARVWAWQISVEWVNVVTTSSTDTLTNKTIDANWTWNSISNIDIADLANWTDWELITWNAVWAPAAVATWTAAQVLTSNWAWAAPTFQAASWWLAPLNFYFAGQLAIWTLIAIPVRADKNAAVISNVTIASPIVPDSWETFDIQVTLNWIASTDSIFTSDTPIKILNWSSVSNGLYPIDDTVIDNWTLATWNTLYVRVVDSGWAWIQLVDLNVTIDF